ncbi:MAG: AAA domain-containing protein [Candidatus Heimdallarchaeota archaeon]
MGKSRNAGQDYYLNVLQSDEGESEIERLILDNANVVCGTVKGILKHPDIETEKTTPKAVFDLLIIDEASKTTFQEFIVPALFCKRWILVGNNMQLSPFVDDLIIKETLNSIIPLAKLKECGAQIKGHKLLHMKGLFIEDGNKSIGMIFTGNLTAESFTNSYDIGIFLSRNQITTILSLVKSWSDIIPLTFFSKKSIKNLKTGKYLSLENDKEIFQLNENEIIDLGEINIDDLKNINDFKSKIIIPELLKFKAKTDTFIWSTKIPKKQKTATKK